MNNNKPLVSIGMPVFNGERFLRKTLDSLLAQDYENFELNISDNASTDQTEDICREYVAKDNRVRYDRNETNYGVPFNFNKVLELASGKYFMWAGDHDLWHPSFISRCVLLFEQYPDAVLVYPQAILIDLQGRAIETIEEHIDTRGLSALQAYKQLIWTLTICNIAYGLFRRSVLMTTGKFRHILGSDHLLLAELVLKGDFAHIQEPLFYMRKNRPDEWYDEEKYKERLMSAIYPVTAAKSSKKTMQALYFKMFCAHLEMLIHAPLTVREKLDAARETVLCFEKRFRVFSRLFRR